MWINNRSAYQKFVANSGNSISINFSGFFFNPKGKYSARDLAPIIKI